MNVREQMTKDERWACLIRGWISFDQESGMTIQPSYGRRKAGRPRRYFLKKGTELLKAFTAHTEEEAVQMANEWLAKNQPT